MTAIEASEGIRNLPRATELRTHLRLGVFGDNRQKPIHRWYPFVEGYSADLVADALAGVAGDGVLLLDPFGGSGTTALAAAERGVDCIFCEVNPYLAWVADVKINCSRSVWESATHSGLERLATALETKRPRPVANEQDHPLVKADQARGFFPRGVAVEAIRTLAMAEEFCEGPTLEVARLAVATSLVPASNMIRRTDLRKRRPGDPEPRDLLPEVVGRLHLMAEDIRDSGGMIHGRASRVAADARSAWTPPRPVDLVVTSPPYLNGTNYCRNTKLELLALDFISDERHLKDLRFDSIAAGINNISSRREAPSVVSSVEEVATALDEVAYDRRIPTMVRMYFSDMRLVFAGVRERSRLGARWLLDIGDSRFSGVHVPTHSLLADVASMEGWQTVAVETLRSRRSYDGSELTQVLLEMEAV